MNVAVVVAAEYPDMDEVRKRLEKGLANPLHKTFIRRQDRILPPIITGLGYDPETMKWMPPEGWGWLTGDGYDNLLLCRMDFVICYHTAKSGVTGYFVKKAAWLPISFGPKVQVIEKKSRVTKTPAKRRQKTRRGGE